MSEIERRRSPRCTVGLPVIVQAGADSLRGQLSSVSRLGALVESEMPFAVGTSLQLIVELPGDLLEVRGQVVRADTTGGGHSLGIMFSPLALPTLTKLESLLATAQPEPTE
jgi:hypothetical protein